MKFKFLTLNTLHGGVFWDNLIEFIHKEDPDIAVFQEVYDGSDNNLEKRFRTIEEFKKEFPELRYFKFEPTIIDSNNKVPWGNAVFSKYEITSSRNYIFNPGLLEYDFENDLPSPAEVPEGILEAEINLNGVNITVGSWHGVWDTHGKDTPARDKMLKIILENLEGKENLILAGDTNLNPDTEFVKKLESKLKIKSVFGDNLESTFNMLHKENPGYATAVVDMIFISNNFKVIDKYMPMDDVSDHRPLVAILEI